MALNLSDRINLLPTMRARVKGVVLNFALFIIGEDPGSANHAARLAWAKNTLNSVDSETELCLPYLTNSPDYTASGSDITDAQLTGHIETAINTNRIG